MVDAKAGMTAGDHDVADLLRRADKPTILVANKADNVNRRDGAFEFYELGLGDPDGRLLLSRLGTGDLLDRVVESAAAFRGRAGNRTGRKIAIVGRPNVGKSRLAQRADRPGALDRQRRPRHDARQPRHAASSGPAGR